MLDGFMKSMIETIDGGDPSILDRPGSNYFDPTYANVYRNNYMSAYRDALLANYPSILALIGRDYCSYMAKVHTENHKHSCRSLVGYGKGFVATIDDFLFEHKLPYLSSFAELDRAWTCAHIATDAPVLDADKLQTLTQSGMRLGDMPLLFQPSIHIVELSWSIFDIWKQLRTGCEIETKVEATNLSQTILMWRYQGEVESKLLIPPEIVFLKSLINGENLGFASQAATELMPDLNVSDLFAAMLAAELFATD